MLNIDVRLAFKDVFPEEEPENILDYLQKVSKDSLVRVIGFCNTKPLPNYYNFFSNPAVAREVVNRVQNFIVKSQLPRDVVIMSPEANLKLAEIILSHRDELLVDKDPQPPENDEMNLFKAFLVINSNLNGRQKFGEDNEDVYEKLVDYVITFSFPLSDLAVFEDDNKEFVKLIQATIIKVEYLFDFLDSNEDFSVLKTGFLTAYAVDNRQEFFRQMKYLFGKLFTMKVENHYLFKVEDSDSRTFLESLVGQDIYEDDDFTQIKANPLYKVDDNIFSVINFFFAVDKFYRSAKFILKGIYEQEISLKKYGNFFGFFNMQFSENFLMRKVLDEIFSKKYYYKKPLAEVEQSGEPDYYVRHNNNVFLFENKDVLIAKNVKASSDIDIIISALKGKFLEENGRSVGVGQLANTIDEMTTGKFRFDNYVNGKNNITVFPILLIHDRIFQSLGINYRLNQWFKNELSEKFVGRKITLHVKNLVVIDIDTLIYWLPYFKEKDKNFKDVLNNHLDLMSIKVKVNTPDYEVGVARVNKALIRQLTPLQHRDVPFKIDIRRFVDHFRDVLPAQ